MALITRQNKGDKLTIVEMDGNLEYLEKVAKGLEYSDPREYIINKIISSDNFVASTQVSDVNIMGNVKPPLDFGTSTTLSSDIFTNGIFIPTTDDYLLPEGELYFLGSVSSFLKLNESVLGLTPSLLNGKKISLVSSVETFLKFNEAVNSSPRSTFTDNSEPIFEEISNPIVQYTFTSDSGFINELLELLDSDFYYEDGDSSKPEFLDIITDSGLIELGQIGSSSKLLYNRIIKNLKLSIESRLNITLLQSKNSKIFSTFLLYIFNLGLVVRQYKDGLFISNTDTYLKLEDAIYSEENKDGDGGGGLVPA